MKKILGLGKEIIAVIILAVIIAIVILIKIGSDGKFTVHAESSLKEIIQTSKLNTMEYIYNGVATKYSDNKKTEEYFVKYHGTVKASIDFSKVEVDVKTHDKKIVVSLPPLFIEDPIIENDLQYIFTKKKYETEDVVKEAYPLCKEDINNKIKNDEFFKKSAEESAKSTITALTKPIVDTFDEEYEIVIEWRDNDENN